MADPQASAAAWYDRTWRQIKEDNGMTDQQATGYMTYMINHGEEGLLQPREWQAAVWYDQTWRQVKADNQDMTDQQVTGYMTYMIENSEQTHLSPQEWRAQESAAWYDRTWRQIKEDNGMTDQQVTDYMTYMINHGEEGLLQPKEWQGAVWYDQTWRQVKADHPEMTDQQVTGYMTNMIENSERLNNEGILKAYWQGFKTNTGGLISDTQHIISELGRPEYIPPEEWQKKEPPVHKAVTEFGERLEAQNERNYEPWSAKWFAYNTGGVIPAALSLGVTTAAALKSGNAQAIRSSTVVTASRLGFGPKAVQFAGELAPATTIGYAATFPEAALEGQNAYDEAIRGGRSSEEAQAIRQSVFDANTKLLSGSNTAEIMLAFAELPCKLPANVITRFATRIASVGLVQGVEEGAQQIIQKQSAGKDWNITDDDIMQSAAIGTLGGLAFGGFGNLAGNINNNRVSLKMQSEIMQFQQTPDQMQNLPGINMEAKSQEADTPPLVPQAQGERAAVFNEKTTQTASQLHAEANMQNFDAYGQMIGPAEAFQEASLAKTPETIVNTLPDAGAQTKTESLNNQGPGTDLQTDAVAYTEGISGQPAANINIEQEAAATAPAVSTGQTITVPANGPAITIDSQAGAGVSYTLGTDGHTAANFNIEQEAYNSQGIHLGYNPKKDTVTYPSRDNFSLQTIPKGTMLARLEPGGDFFIANDETARILESRDAAKISEACQVAPVKRFGGYRQKLNIYEMTEGIPGAVGKAMANDQYGTGGVTEVFIKNSQELEAMGILKKVDTVKLTNWEVSEERFEEIKDALDEKVSDEWSVSQNKPVSIEDISIILQRSLEETQQALAASGDQSAAIRQQLERDRNDIGGMIDELTPQVEQNRMIEVQGPLTTRNILRQGEQIIAQVKSLSPTEQKISGFAADISLAMGTAALGEVADDRDKPAKRNAIDAQPVENVPTVSYSTVKVEDVWITLMHERNRAAAEIGEQARQRSGLKGEPMTEEQVREQAASDYVHGEDRELARQTQALQRDCAQLQKNEAWNNEFGRQNGFDRPFWKYVPGWLKSDLIKEYEHNLKTIDRQHEELAYRESELVEKTEKLQERLQSPGAQKEIERQIPLYLARDAERLEQLAKTDEEIAALTGEQKQIDRMKSCFSLKIADRLIRVEGDPGDAANIMRQFDQIQEQVQAMPEIAQQHCLAR